MDFISQSLVLLNDELFSLFKDFIERGTDLEQRNEVALGVVGNLVSRLLLRSWVDDQRSTRHGVHIVVFSADVHVDGITFISLCLQFVFVTLNIELVQRKAVRRLS